jgi:hypothetical protein
VEEVTDEEEDADRWAPPIRGREGKRFGNGCWAVESIQCWAGLDPLAPFPFFSSFFYSFLFLFFLYNFCINPPNKVKSMSKIF